jgi:hypothetical protein
MLAREIGSSSLVLRAINVTTIVCGALNVPRKAVNVVWYDRPALV